MKSMRRQFFGGVLRDFRRPHWILFWLVIAGVVAYSFGPVRGWVEELLWDGQSTLGCSGNEVMTVTGKTVRVPQGRAFTAAGNCQLTIIDCDVVARDGVFAAGHARVTLKGGRLEGTKNPLVAMGGARIVVEGTEVVGKIASRRGISGLPE